MSVTTLAPLDRSARNTGESVLADPSAVFATAAKNYTKAADKWAAAYIELGQSVDKIGMARTALAALTVRALDEADDTGKGATLAAISARLGEVDPESDEDEDKRLMLNSALPGQWRTAAAIYVDLGMTPDEPVARWLTSAKPAGLADAVRKAVKIAAKDGQTAGVKSLTDFADSKATGARKRRELGFKALPAIEPKADDNGAPDTKSSVVTPGADATKSDEDKGGGTGTTNGPKSGKVDLTPVKSNRDAVEVIETAMARIDWSNLTDEDKASLSAIASVITEHAA